MFILRDLLTPLQAEFSTTQQGQKRKIWFAYTLLAIIIPFTSSMTSNLLRSLQTLFGLDIKSQRFYTFMATTTLPWDALWSALWSLIPEVLTDGRLLLALDDSINPKSGKSIFACGYFHNHATKGNQTSYPWSQCILMLGLLKQVKSRWVCLPLGFRFYMMQKMIVANCINTVQKGKVVTFKSKMEQAANMITAVFAHFHHPILIVADSWFGNDGLWSRLSRGNHGDYNLLSRLRINIILYGFPSVNQPGGKRDKGRPRKYGKRLGSVADCAVRFKEKAKTYSVFLYGKQRDVTAYSQTAMSKTLKCPIRIVWIYRQTRYVALFTTDLELSIEQLIEYYGARWKIEAGFKEIKQEIGSSTTQTRTPDAVINHLSLCLMATTLIWVYADRLEKTPDRRHKIRGRSSFAFSDVRKMMAEAALHPDFQSVCPLPMQVPQKSFVKTLLRLIA
jgi:hypothetical protein